MDLYCKFCREPIDAYEFHDMTVEDFNPRYHKEIDRAGGDYQAKVFVFKKYGCDALDGYNSNCKPSDKVDPCIEAVYELLGDDTDGAASILEDYFS